MYLQFLTLFCVAISVNLVAPQDATKQYISCQNGWILNNGHCYLFGKNKKNWDQAKRDCKNRDSELLKVDDVGENVWLKSLMDEFKSDGMWIGLTDISREGTYRWISDNTGVTFTDWDKNQPDDAANNEDCVEIWNRSGKRDAYQWNDRICTAKLNYMCEK